MLFNSKHAKLEMPYMASFFISKFARSTSQGPLKRETLARLSTKSSQKPRPHSQFQLIVDLSHLAHHQNLFLCI